jgi:hypothetical protein
MHRYSAAIEDRAKKSPSREAAAAAPVGEAVGVRGKL